MSYVDYQKKNRRALTAGAAAAAPPTSAAAWPTRRKGRVSPSLRDLNDIHVAPDTLLSPPGCSLRRHRFG